MSFVSYYRRYYEHNNNAYHQGYNKQRYLTVTCVSRTFAGEILAKVATLY